MRTGDMIAAEISTETVLLAVEPPDHLKHRLSVPSQDFDEADASDAPAAPRRRFSPAEYDASQKPEAKSWQDSPEPLYEKEPDSSEDAAKH